MAEFTVQVTLDPMVSPSQLAALLRDIQAMCHQKIKRAQGSGNVNYIQEQASLAGAIAAFADAIAAARAD